MSNKEKPLPKPPSTPFGRKRHAEQEQQPLMADQIAQAAAEGKLDEFMHSEVPDSEYARSLVSMMLGMTGMLPPEGLKPPPPEEKSSGIKSEAEAPEGPPPMPSEDVLKAVQAGDVEGLMGLLRQEHEKRSPDAIPADRRDTPAQESAVAGAEKVLIEKVVIDEIIRISEENNLSPDWVMLRALKLYVQEYQKTGRL